MIGGGARIMLFIVRTPCRIGVMYGEDAWNE